MRRAGEMIVLVTVLILVSISATFISVTERNRRLAVEAREREANGLISQLSKSNARACYTVNALRNTLREADEAELETTQAPK